MNQDIAIKLENVSKTFYIQDSINPSILGGLRHFRNLTNKRKIEAVKNVSIEIKKGEFVGIIGANGSGKSTLMNLMSGAYKPDKGGLSSIYGIYMRLSLGLGFNPELSARENLFINATIMGLSYREIRKRIDTMFSFAELNDFKDIKIKYYSKGMKARLAFAVAVHAKPEILLLDEIFGGVGDQKFKEKSERTFTEKLLKGRTIVLVSHSLEVIRNHADRVILMHKGECIKIGNPEDVFEQYRKLLNLKKLKI